MRIVIVVKNWRDSNLEQTRRDNLNEGLFEPGAYFEGEFFLEPEDEKVLREALRSGYYPEVILNRP